MAGIATVTADSRQQLRHILEKRQCGGARTANHLRVARPHATSRRSHEAPGLYLARSLGFELEPSVAYGFQSAG